MPRSSRRLALALVGGPFVAAALLLLAELALRLLTPADSPFAPPRYFERREQEGRAALVPSANPPMASARFWPASIPLEKPAGARRILCLGDSTVHGHPFEPPAPFADWLAARLLRLLPGSKFEVVNLGANGMGSEEVADLVGELAPLHPDLVVVYVGHNEFLENGADAVRRPLTHWFGRFAARSCLLRRVSSWLHDASGAGGAGGAAATPAPAGARPLVDDEPFFRPEELERGRERYADHLGAIARAITAMGATPLLCLPVCDLVDTPPERSSFAAATTLVQRAQVRTGLALLREQRQDLEQHGAPAAEARALLAEVEALAQVDGSVAAIDYERGRLLRLCGDDAAARDAFVRARDHDGHPIREPGAMLDLVRSTANATGALLVDPWPLFAAAARGGLAGQDGFFVDYVHPDLAGHRLLAEAILRTLAEHGLFAPGAQWRFDAEPSAAEYEAAMGLSRAKLADSLARRGMFALGQGYLDPKATEAMRAAEDLFATALSVEPDCALAHAGRGALALVRGDGERALAEIDHARELDPASLASLLENYDRVAAVRQLFDRAGLVLQDGRFVRR